MTTVDVVKFKVFIEGIYIPKAHTVSIQSSEGTVSRADISFPPVPGFEMEELKRAHVLIFHSDAASRRQGLSYRLLFEGEIAGDSFQKSRQSRDMSFSCVGLTSYLDQARLYYIDAGHTDQAQVLTAKGVAAAFGLKSFKFDVGVAGVSVVDTISAIAAKKATDGEYYKIIDEILKRVSEINYFFNTSVSRLKLRDRFLAVTGGNLKKLSSQDILLKAIRSDIGAMSGEMTVMALVGRILGIIRYGLVHNSQPMFNEEDGKLNEFIMTPDTRFSAIPWCNVLTPSVTSGVSMSRNLLAEPTRALAMPYTDDLGIFRDLLMAPPNLADRLRRPPDTPGDVRISASGYAQPLDEYRVTSIFGVRTLKGQDGGTTRHHDGLDLGKVSGSILGAPVMSIGDGLISRSGFQDYDNKTGAGSGYGYRIYVTQDDGLEVLYAHLKEEGALKSGRVSKGDTIGYIGKTGNTFGVHLHIGIKKNGKFVDPSPYLSVENKKGAVPAETQEEKEDLAKKYDEGTSIDESTTFEDYKFLTPEERYVGIEPYIDHETSRINDMLAEFDDGEEKNAYYQNLITAEFYGRRFGARSISPFTIPFTSNPVPGFPGLVLDRDRSIIAKITGVSHSLSMRGGGSSFTTVSMVNPRYWNEGDPYYWKHGQAKKDDDGPDKEEASFPAYYPTTMIPENDAEPEYYQSKERSIVEKKTDREADNEFLRLLGVRSISCSMVSRTSSVTGEKVYYNAAIADGPNTILGEYEEARASGTSGAWTAKKTFRPSVTEDEYMSFVGAVKTNVGYSGGVFRAEYQTKLIELNRLLNQNNVFRG